MWAASELQIELHSLWALVLERGVQPNTERTRPAPVSPPPAGLRRRPRSETGTAALRPELPWHHQARGVQDGHHAWSGNPEVAFWGAFWLGEASGKGLVSGEDLLDVFSWSAFMPAFRGKPKLVDLESICYIQTGLLKTVVRNAACLFYMYLNVSYVTFQCYFLLTFVRYSFLSRKVLLFLHSAHWNFQVESILALWIKCGLM